MNFFSYLKERILFIGSTLGIVIFQWFLFSVLNVSRYAIFLVSFLYIICNFVYLFIEFRKKSTFLNNMNSQLDFLDEKYLLSEIIDEPSSIEDKEFYNVLKVCNKSMNDNIGEFNIASKEYREYIELWVHEVKTPIASSKLLIENHLSKVTESIGEEIDKIENYIEQALFYTRSNGVEKDYIIKSLNLEEEVNSVIRRNAKDLIQMGVKIEKLNLDKIIYSDSKWLGFILHQIVSNSIKYFDKDIKELTFRGEDKGEDVILSIIDNGTGMDEKTTLKAFDKGYTGENGRKFKESTGIGLYLCKKLCRKLGLSIKIYSEKSKGTTISILFPKNKMLLLEN